MRPLPTDCARVVAAILLFFGALGAGGCGFAAALNADAPSKGALLHDGFVDVVIQHSPEFPSAGQPVTVSVVTSGLDPTASGAAVDPTALAEKAVWTTYPFHFDSLRLSIIGNSPVTVGADQLSSVLGARPSGLDAEVMSESVQSGFDVLYVIGGMLLFLLVVHIVRHEIHKHDVHKDRILENSLAHQHLHQGQHEIDLWSGSAHTVAGHPGDYAAVHAGPPNAPVHAAVGHTAPAAPPTGPPLPWTGHAAPPHPGPPPTGVSGPPGMTGPSAG